jgi:hypothetical protein
MSIYHWDLNGLKVVVVVVVVVVDDDDDDDVPIGNTYLLTYLLHGAESFLRS